MYLSVSFADNLACYVDCAVLVHAVHLETQLCYSKLSLIPFKVWNGTQLDISHLCIFGLVLTAKSPGQHPAKLGKHIYDCIFLSVEGSSRKNVMYLDVHSGGVRVGDNIEFDEAHFTTTLG